MKLKRLFCLVPTLVKYPLFHLTSLFIHIQHPNVLPHLQFAQIQLLLHSLPTLRKTLQTVRSMLLTSST